MRKINLIGDIDYEMLANFEEELARLTNKNDDGILVLLSSEGGLHEVSLAIASRIRLCSCEITIVAIGTAASAASLILAYGDKRLMAKEAWVMVHEESCKMKGSVSEYEKETKHLRQMEDQACKLFAERSKVSAEEWSRMHKETTWLSAEQCLELGLIEEII